MRRTVEHDLLRLNMEAAINHRGWNIADVFDPGKQKREEKDHE